MTEAGKDAVAKWITFALLAATLAAMAAFAPTAAKESHRADFERYYTAGCAAANGDDIYAPQDDRQFKYLPFFAQLMAPLAIVSECAADGEFTRCIFPSERGLKIGAYLWYCLLCTAYLGSLSLAATLCRPANARERLAALAAALAFSARLFVDNARNGQINLPVLFLALLGCSLVLRSRKWAGGAAIAFAAAIKFMPALLLLWLAKRRDWRAAAGLALFALAALFVFPAANWGFGRNAEMLRGYAAKRNKMVTDLPDRQAAGQSLPSLSNRLLSRVNAAPLRLKDERGHRRLVYINVVDSRRAAKLLAVALSLLACAVIWLNLKPESDAGARAALELGAMFLLLLLVSPEARKAHYISVLLPAAALACVWARGALAKSRLTAALAGLAFAALALSSEGVLGEGNLYTYLNAYGVMLWGGLLLFAACLAQLRSEPEKSELTTELKRNSPNETRPATN